MRINWAEALSLLDHFGHFDVPIFDDKAQVFDPRFLILRSSMLKPRLYYNIPLVHFQYMYIYICIYILFFIYVYLYIIFYSFYFLYRYLFI